MVKRGSSYVLPSYSLSTFSITAWTGIAAPSFPAGITYLTILLVPSLAQRLSFEEPTFLLPGQFLFARLDDGAQRREYALGDGEYAA